MHIFTQTVTPEIAKGYLEQNTHNRPLSEIRVRQMAEQMRRGEWRLNGDALRFSADGRLLDGQHRLAAIAASGISQPTLVVTGLEDSCFDTIDTGATRKVGDLLALKGVKNAATAAAVARRYLTWRNTGHPYSASPEKRPTNAQILGESATNPLIERAASFGSSHMWLRRNLGAADVGFAYTAFTDVSEQAARHFLLRLNAPDDFSDTPGMVRRFRERVMESRASQRPLTAAHRTALVFKMFRLTQAGKDVQQLRIRLEGSRPESDLYRVAASND